MIAMRKTTLKLGLSLFTLLFCFGMMAQKGEGKERRALIQEKKMTYCSEQAGLTETESEKYWTLVTELGEEKKVIRKKNKNLKDIDLDTASDTEIEATIKSTMQAKVYIQELELAYVDRYLEVLSAKKLALVKKAERGFKKEMLRDLRRTPPSPRGKN